MSADPSNKENALRASIITPVFNAIAFIEDCVENVVEQGDVVLEHIVVDGGSNDGTVEKIHELARHHEHLRFIGGPDRGQSDAMNKGSAAALGDVIGILNVDDFYQPGTVARGVRRLAQVGKPALVVGNCRIIDKDGNTVLWNRPTDLRLESLLLDSYLLPLPANPSAYFYSRDVHDLTGGYDVDDHYAMDMDFILRCVARVPVLYVDEHWGNFRYIPGAKTFDDSQGAARLTTIIARHKEHLTPAQRATMKRIWRVRRLQDLVQRKLARFRPQRGNDA